MTDAPPTISDAEIQAHLFRLMRSGQYSRATALLQALQKDFPHESEERLRDCARKLVSRL